VTTGIINGLTVTAGKGVGLNVKLVSAPDTGEKTRANYIGVGVAGTSEATAGAATQVNSFIKFTAPTTAGTYPMTIQHSVDGFFTTAYPNEDRPFADIAFTLTVKAASGLSTALSTAYIMGPAAGAGAGDTTTNVAAYSAVKKAGTKIAQIEVTLKNADGSAAKGLHTVAASITGSGFVTVDTMADAAPGAARASSLAADAGGLAYVHIAADGNAGVGTITVTVTDSATFATTTLGTWTVTSSGSVTKLTATAIYTVGRAGGFTTGSGSSNRTTDAIIPAVIIKATDSLGNIVSGLTISALSSNTASVNSAIIIAEDTPLALFSSGGLGFYNASFSTTSAAKSGDVATLTFRILDPADPLGVAFLTAPVTVTVGGTIATETLSLDKTSYDPGEAMVITRTAKDSAGNPVYDGAASPAVTFNKAVGGTPSVALGAYVGGVSATSATKPSVFAPVTGGAFLASMTSGNTAKSLVTATATIAADTTATDISQAAADAAAEATDAANAATDAANAAAEAADAATAAAQDAADAVAALSTQVAGLIGDLRKQITSLTNLVIKIQKKVKA
jgi:hypothetical protein